MNLIGNIDLEAKQWLVDRNPNSWCRAFFKMDRGCAAYENGISESYHNSIRIARGKPLITMLEEIRVYLMQRLYSMHNLAANLGDNITPSIKKEIERLKHSKDTGLYPSSAGPSVADPSSAGPSVADLTGSGTQSERIAKRAKAFQFGKDGAGSCPDKAWDVDDVLAEKMMFYCAILFMLFKTFI
nr:hypothetical protein [Tanacetum cinerariifolium]